MDRVPTDEVSRLVARLNENTKLKKAGRCKRRVNLVQGSSDVQLSSWKFNDWDYYDNAKVTLPIYSRGLFTFNDSEIIIRGYNKFFNVDETACTKKASLRELTGPFEVTLKENGCIIFIGGMATGELVVTSKNSTGSDLSPEMKNHAAAGLAFLTSQLGNDDTKIRELAEYLYNNNLTAVAEYCDDEFEEHVLAYPKDRAGLYLTGLNYNTIEFATKSMPKVIEFAETWGFRTIDWLVYHEVDELFKFLDKCAETGTYKDVEVEGFVVRGFRDGKNFFFKYKFEEPYLLYRQLREVTSKYLVSGSTEMPIKKHRVLTQKYLQFVAKLFADEPSVKQRFIDKVGIIEVRQRFLDSIHQSSGINLIQDFEKLSLTSAPSAKYVVVPVATIGVGKTSVFHILSKVFGWSHIQNDNILSSTKKKLVDQTLAALSTNQVVLMDRNNSSARERAQIFKDFSLKRGNYLDPNQPVRFIGIDFIGGRSDDTLAQLWEITWPRVQSRGDNHQSLKSLSDPATVQSVMKGFIGRYEPLDKTGGPDRQFDLAIHLDLRPESSVANTLHICRVINQLYPDVISSVPDQSVLSRAFDDAQSQKVTLTKNMASKQSVAYYGISIDRDRLMAIVSATLGDLDTWSSYQKNNRVQGEFHVTLAHSASARGNAKPKWKLLQKTFPSAYDHKPRNQLNYTFDVIAKSVVVSDRVICVEVETVGPNPATESAVSFLNKHLHVTVGTADVTIRPFESNQLLTAIADGTAENYLHYHVAANVAKLAEQPMFASFI